jgi:hypothetical protein
MLEIEREIDLIWWRVMAILKHELALAAWHFIRPRKAAFNK